MSYNFTEGSGKKANALVADTLNGVSLGGNEEVARTILAFKTGATAVKDAATGAGAVTDAVLRITHASDDPLLALVADTTSISPVAEPTDVIPFTPTLDTGNAYASGDVLFATAAIASVGRANDKAATLVSLVATDKSDNKPSFTIYFFKSNVTSGAFNVAPSISDAHGVDCLGYVSVLSGDYKDLGGVSVICVKNIGLTLKPVALGTTVYAFAVLDAGPYTFTSGDLVLQLGVIQ